MQGGRIVAFSPATGHIRWSRTIGPSESSPLVEDGTLYAADQDGYVYAFDARTGHLRWRFNTGAPIKASPAFAYGRIYIGNYAAEMLALDARTGRLIWRSVGYGNFYSTASVNAGRVYVGSLDDRVYAFSATDRRRALELRDRKLRLRLAGRLARARPRRLVRPHVLRARRRNRLDPLDLPRGRPDLRRRVGRRRHRLLLELRAPDVRALATSGRLRVEWPDGQYSPVVAADGRLYLVGLGRIYALRPRR